MLTFSQKRENRPCSFFKTRMRYLCRLEIWKLISIRFVFWRLTSLPFFVCNHTSASGNFICLSSHGKILAESFQFDWKENIFYKLERYIQPDCITTNQPSQTELSKCHDREKRSWNLRSAHSHNWNLRSRLAESWRKLPSAFSKTKTWIKKIYFRKTDSYSWPDKAGIIRISHKAAFIRTVLSVEKFTAVWNLIAYSLIWKKTPQCRLRDSDSHNFK